ncbi:oxidoreductase [Mycolicibacter heraklionensis]|nr:oxidoreductase [Mycolicibacter heraklionensis]
MAQFDGLRPARLKVGVISAGRVGTALGVALERAEHVVVACSAISEESRERARRRLPDSLIRPAPDVAADAELLVLAVPDTELAGIVSGLAATGAVRAGTIVVHTSGATGIGVLAPLTEQGCLPLAIHPAMTFTGSDEDIDRLSESCFGITAADEIGFAIAEALTLEIGAEPFRVEESARTLYHAALCHGANHLVTVIDDALAALRAALPGRLGSHVADDPDGIAERVLGPLVRAALANTLRDGRAALTGPVARGDSATLARHLGVLAGVDTDLAEAYRTNALRTAHRAGAADDVLEVLAQ